MFTIPNEADAFNGVQADVDKVDLDILVAGYEATGVVSGCGVTAQGTPDMTLAVAAGTASYIGATVAVTAGNVTITTAHATNPRIDLVVVSSAGAKSVVAGTPAAAPVMPAIPASSVVLAAVYVPATDTAIQSNQITDKRVPVIRPTLLHVRDAKASGTSGGTFTSGSWQKRTLQTVLTNELGTGLTADEITGLPAGVYEVTGSAPAFYCGNHQARLYDVTGAAVLVLGGNAYSPAVDTSNPSTRSPVLGRFTLTATSTVRLEHRCSVTRGSDGFGNAANWGTEVYADLQIRKVG